MAEYILMRVSLCWLTLVHLHQVHLFVSPAAPPPTQSGDIRPVNYNPLRPPKKGDSPVRVKVNIHVNTLLSVEEFEQVICHPFVCDSPVTFADSCKLMCLIVSL